MIYKILSYIMKLFPRLSARVLVWLFPRDVLVICVRRWEWRNWMKARRARKLADRRGAK